MARNPMDKAKKIKIFALYNEGIPTANIAERFGLSRDYVGDLVRKMRVKDGQN
jgi:DNA-binding transcriptional regulator LsrR (DeoR family)